MAERHELKISIGPTGDVQIEVEGVKGNKCLKLTEDLENELGILINREKKADYYVSENETNIDTKIE
jgi:hypothetical protein